MKIVLFDLDDTLITSSCRNHALMQICRKIAKLANKNPKQIFTQVINIWCKEKNPKVKYDWDSHLEKLCSQLGIKKKFNYEAEIKRSLNKAKAFPDTIPVLKYLKAHNYKIYIITNGLKKYQLPIIRHLGLLKYISRVYSPYNGVLKPNPKIFKNQFNFKNIKLYIDDQLYQGIYLGKKIKSPTGLISRNYHGGLKKFIKKKLKSEARETKFHVSIKRVTPDYIIKDLRQVKKILK